MSDDERTVTPRRRSVADVRARQRRAWMIGAALVGALVVLFVATSPRVRLGTATLSIETEPSRANVIIDGALRGATPLETTILAGEHVVRVEHPYRRTHQERVNVERGDEIRRSLVLGERFATLVLMSNPRGAWVELDGTRLESTTPVTLERIVAGPHKLRVGSDGHRPVEVELELPPEARIEHVVELHLSPKGRLSVVTVPEDATVTLLNVDREYEDGMSLPLGEYEALIEREGYAARHVRLPVVQERNLHRVKLERLYGRLQVAVVPDNAELTITYDVGGEMIRRAYLEDMRIPTGEVKLRARAMGYRTSEKLIRLGVDGAHIEIALTELAVRPGETFRDPMRDGTRGPLLVMIPAGSFTMGSNAAGSSMAEKPTHGVTITEPFAVGVYEITRAQYAAFVRATGTDGAPTVPEEEEQLPAVHVDFADAQAYVEWLSHMTGERYRLLSEAEWEYVARAQTQGAYFFGDESTEICRYANIADERTKVRFNTWYAAACDDGHSKLAPVGRFEPNPFGVYDIYGNAAEWVEDCWHLGYVDAPTDGSPWTAGPCETRVVRGGGWDARADDVRSAARYSAAYASDDRGIRVAREL